MKSLWLQEPSIPRVLKEEKGNSEGGLSSKVARREEVKGTELVG
jgi:hypothetical protein